ncbi:MAG: hypothetical protein HYV60_12785, partial [Planctomycetia bacterium]|nr:hypothetical protein [Planctomycetia bacterium]
DMVVVPWDHMSEPRRRPLQQEKIATLDEAGLVKLMPCLAKLRRITVSVELLGDASAGSTEMSLYVQLPLACQFANQHVLAIQSKAVFSRKHLPLVPPRRLLLQ